MKVVISGASGLIGSSVAESLSGQGHEIFRLVRSEPENEHEINWDPGKGTIDSARLKGIDAVIHLAGEGIADGRWNPEKKKRIRDSRVEGTRIVCGALAKLEKRPGVLVNASAIGIYGDRGEEILREDSAPGTGFLADVCKEWEKATAAAEKVGIRVVKVRFGVVLSEKGGALPKMLTPFKLGIAGRLGTGKQYMSWVALDDVVGIINFALNNLGVAGPVNVVSPQPVTNEEFTKTLGRVLSRPTILPMPACVLRLAVGELANELVASTRVEPARMSEAGYQFAYPELEGTLRRMLK